MGNTNTDSSAGEFFSSRRIHSTNAMPTTPNEQYIQDTNGHSVSGPTIGGSKMAAKSRKTGRENPTCQKITRRGCMCCTSRCV